MKVFNVIMGCLVWVNMAQTQNVQDLEKKVDSLKVIHIYYKDSLNYLKKQLYQFEDSLFYIQVQRDSVQKLSDAARYREKLYRKEALRLKNLLIKTDNQVDSLSKIYDSLSYDASKTLKAYQVEIKRLVKERNDLVNQILNRQKNQLKVMNIKAMPGHIVRQKFAATVRASRVALIQVNYELNRLPFSDKRIRILLLNPDFQPIALDKFGVNQSEQIRQAKRRFTLEPRLDIKFKKGVYTVILLLYEVNIAPKSQVLSQTTFRLK